MKVTLVLTCEDGGYDTRQIGVDAIDQIGQKAEAELEDWIRDGEWGDGGASVEGRWSVHDIDGEKPDETLSGYHTVEIEPRHEWLIQQAAGRANICGTDPNDHDWTSEGEGGLEENPGVWSTGGTKMTFAAHCRKCGLHRTVRVTGSQRNPGEHDTVEYRMLDEDEIRRHRRRGSMDEPDEK